MVEINHDLTPQSDDELLAWATAMQTYLGSGVKTQLPDGVEWFGMRHHTEKAPLEQPTERTSIQQTTAGQRLINLINRWRA
jgi:hypothetical protein